ncbi:MAG: hypothetical protein Solumvirus2_44 [Solumvirus sp.]|uniref:Uncharacterized protein n=1 Tax=Solumvirus sp. TaxID=2487773 RepID=A0A3G5AGC8_9VIRU|nr:MAG: hypothetical protein Solumvirus2_44 [Solumvirus sp.]
MKFLLDMTVITGKLDSNTPFCVLSEIFDAHGFVTNDLVMNTVEKHQQYITAIDKSIPYLKSIEISDTKDAIVKDIDLRYVATFVNNKCKWKPRNLRDAFRFLLGIKEDGLEFTHSSPSSLNTPSLVDLLDCGLQDNDNPYRYNACKIYALCRKNNITLLITDNLRDMISKLRSKIFCRDTLLKSVYCLVNTLDNNELSTILSQFGKKFKNSNTTKGVKDIPNNKFKRSLHREHSETTALELSKINKDFNDIKYLQSRMIPKTHNEAIMLAAINYNTDISMSTTEGGPLTQYLLINLDQKINDPDIKLLNSINRELIQLSKTFNPIFPKEYYKTINSQYNYEEQSYLYLTENFYYGLQPEINNETSMINLTSLSEVKNNEVVCYGLRNGKMKFFIIDELTSLFNHNLNFYNQEERKFFTSSSINHLKDLCRIYNTGSLIKLLKSIEMIQNANKNLSSEELKLKDCWIDNESKKRVIDILGKIHEISMYMRGWRGNKDSSFADTKLPIEIALVEPNEQKNVESRTITAIAELDQMWEVKDNVSEVTKSLPLKRFIDGRFVKSRDQDDGLTIFDRVNIVKQGSTPSSCIRLSSNWLAASAYSYMELLGIKVSFNIYKLRNIS